MLRLNITGKIWLSVGVFICGYVLSTTLGQIQSREVRASLRTAAQGLFPAAQLSEEANSALQRMVKGFGDAVIMQDGSALDRAAEDGRQTVAALNSIAAIGSLPAGRADEARRLAGVVEALCGDARATYGAVLSNTLTDATQAQVQSLASRNEQAKTSLAKAKELLAADLRRQLEALEQSSATQSRFALAVFVVTLLLAGVIVHLTIRRSITAPVVRVIGGVQTSAEQAAQTSMRVARAGQEVSSNAQEQSACIEETSASLEEISATTRQNADRAGEADHLMREARQTVERASRAMAELTSSMGQISKSSHQVAAVLKTIDEIAFHTNILALNAAVEAARAGEAGAGFSVVADEVRSLAHRAAESARNSGNIIEQTVSDIARGVDLVAHAHRAFEDVAAKISGGSEIVSQIAVSSDEQARGIGNVNEAITRIASITQRNLAHAQQTAEGASAMATEVETTRKYLGELVGVVGLRSA